MKGKNISIIRHRGRVMKTRTLKGREVERQDSLLVPEWAALVPCAPYDTHFLYADPTPGQSAYMCTCGSPAVVINQDDTRLRMLVCLFHAQYNIHVTSKVNLKDFPEIAGETIKL